MDDIKKFIQENWHRGRVPITNGIIFNNGTLYEVNYNEIIIQGVFGYEVKVCNKKSTLSNNADLTYIYETDSVKDDGRIYSCGEAAWGGDGYIACADMSTNDLIWVAFFEYSNPFTSMKLEGGRIKAKNNHGHIWSINIQNPIDITVA
jgi:hypothetical protein